MATWTVDIGDVTRVDGPVGTTTLRPRERAVVAALALAHPEPATNAEIASLVWGADAPATARKAVNNHVMRIRGAAPGLVETTTDGYRFGVAVDVAVRPSERAFAELADVPRVAIERATARERHLAEIEAAAYEAIRTLDADDAATHIAALVDEEPQRAIRWWWWIAVTARLGQRRLALDRLRHARDVVDHDGAGAIDGDFDELEQIVLTDDPLLDSDAVLSTPSGAFSPGRGAVGHLDPAGESERLRQLLQRDDVTSVLVSAPSGAGKTSLCRDVADSLAGAGWNVSWCAIARGVDTTASFERLADHLERRRPDVEPAAALIDRLQAAIAARTARPRLVVIDDIQFLTGDRLDWITTLIGVAHSSGTATTLLLTSRDPDVGAASLVDHHQRLQPWSAETVEVFVHHFVPPSRWAHDAATWIHRRSGGNALFVRELTLDVVGAASTGQPDAARNAGVVFVAPDRSETASSAAALRLGQLGESTRRVLASAALAGRHFEPRDLPGDRSTVERAMAEARAAGVVERLGDGPWRFRHDAYRDALIGDLDDDLLDAAGTSGPDPFVPALVAAAERAVAERRLADATRLYRRAADMIEQQDGRGARWAEVMVELGSSALSVGDDDAIDVLLDAARCALDLRLERVAAYALRHACRVGPANVVGGSDDRVRPLVERALADVDDPAARAIVAIAATALYGFAADADRSRRLYDAAVEAAHEAGDPDVIADVLRSGYLSILRPDEVELRRRTADELDRLAVDLGRADLRYEACRLRISVVTELGEADPRSLCREVEELAAGFAERSRNWSLFSFASMISFLDGDLERAEATIMRLTGDDVVASPSLVLATLGAHLLGLRLAAGRMAELGPTVEDLVERQPDVAAWRGVSAVTLAHQGRGRDARRRFDSVLPAPPHGTAPRDLLPADVTRVPTITCLGRAAIELGDEQRGARVLAVLEPYAGRWTWHGTGTFGPIDHELALLHRLLGDHDASRRAARAAVASAARVGAPLLAAQAAALLVDVPVAASADR